MASYFSVRTLAGVITALGLAGGPASTVVLAAVRIALQASGDAISGGIFASGSTLPGYFEAGSPRETVASGLTEAVTAAGCLAAATQAGGYVNRGNSWLGQLAGQPQGMPLTFA